MVSEKVGFKEWAPSTWGLINVEVEVTDFSGVRRVVVAYTSGEGLWQTVDLAQSTDPNTGVGVLPLQAGLEYFAGGGWGRKRGRQ